METESFLIRVRRRRNCCWQIYPNALHVGLAQAHHHEAGEEKEHDVDQRNDLDTRVFLRKRRSAISWLVSRKRPVMVKVIGIFTLETVPGLNRHRRKALVAALSRIGFPMLCAMVALGHRTAADINRQHADAAAGELGANAPHRDIPAAARRWRPLSRRKWTSGPAWIPAGLRP